MRIVLLPPQAGGGGGGGGAGTLQNTSSVNVLNTSGQTITGV